MNNIRVAAFSCYGTIDVACLSRSRSENNYPINIAISDAAGRGFRLTIDVNFCTLESCYETVNGKSTCLATHKLAK